MHGGGINCNDTYNLLAGVNTNYRTEAASKQLVVGRLKKKKW
jgi:hypothetical protein